jgi:pSer/pThr/pTyr-binding forkhead associated (FHA) protein
VKSAKRCGWRNNSTPSEGVWIGFRARSASPGGGTVLCSASAIGHPDGWPGSSGGHCDSRPVYLPRCHFRLQCAEMLHIVTDAGSSNGTYVNGMRLPGSLLRPRDAIYAGRTAFRFAPVLGGKAMLDSLPESPGELLPWQSKLIATLESSCNFVVLDGAIGPAIRDLLNQAGVFYQSLYEGAQAVDLAPFGPYLAEIQKGGKLMPFLIKVGWGKSWGVFLSAPMAFAEARKHLRHFLMVDIEGGQRVIFRFYDPRVMRVFIPTCNAEQRKEFFGQIQHFFVESEVETIVNRYGVGGDEQFELMSTI